MICSDLYPSLRWISHAGEGGQIVSTRQLYNVWGGVSRPTNTNRMSRLDGRKERALVVIDC